MNITPDNITRATDIIFKMRQDGRMDKEEAFLLLDVIFSGEMDEFAFNMIQFIYKVRPHGDFSDLDDGEDEGEWETIVDFSNMPGGSMRADEFLRLLMEDEEE